MLEFLNKHFDWNGTEKKIWQISLYTGKCMANIDIVGDGTKEYLLINKRLNWSKAFDLIQRLHGMTWTRKKRLFLLYELVTQQTLCSASVNMDTFDKHVAYSTRGKKIMRLEKHTATKRDQQLLDKNGYTSHVIYMLSRWMQTSQKYQLGSCKQRNFLNYKQIKSNTRQMNRR